MKKHVPVTDMTFGQLYDAVAGGEELCLNGKAIIIDSFGILRLAEEKSCTTMAGIKNALNDGYVYKEIPWTDQLDGSWENGVWCMCKSHIEKPCFEKVIEKTTKKGYKTDSTVWPIATPLPQDLADQLEDLCQN